MSISPHCNAAATREKRHVSMKSRNIHGRMRLFFATDANPVDFGKKFHRLIWPFDK